MAKALGSRVFAGHVKEIGWGSIALTNEGASSCLNPLQEADAAVLHWHGDSFDLPKGARRLASNTHYENQAFAYGRNILASSFTWKLIHASSKNGMSAMPSSWPPRRFR